MLSEIIFDTIYPITAFPHAADYRKENRRTPAPKCGIALPEVFHTVLDNVLELCSMICDLYGQDFIAESMHRMSILTRI